MFCCVNSWGRWDDIMLHARFKRQFTAKDIETIARALVSWQYIPPHPNITFQNLHCIMSQIEWFCVIIVNLLTNICTSYKPFV